MFSLINVITDDDGGYQGISLTIARQSPVRFYSGSFVNDSRDADLRAYSLGAKTVLWSTTWRDYARDNGHAIFDGKGNFVLIGE